MPKLGRPRALLLDYGGTLVEEVGYDPRAGNAALLSHADHLPAGIDLDTVMRHAERLSVEIFARRDEFQLETPWPAVTRLIHDSLGVRFSVPIEELELAFWQAAVETRPMPGAREALAEFHRRGIRMGVVSNCSFSQNVLRDDLTRHGLAEHLQFIMVSAEYVVRKPNMRLFETAAAKLGLSPGEIWFVGDRLDTDMAGAKAAGMVSVWFDPKNRNAAGDIDLRVSGWPELLDYVQDLSGATDAA